MILSRLASKPSAHSASSSSYCARVIAFHSSVGVSSQLAPTGSARSLFDG
jgi:hypothetical protein